VFLKGAISYCAVASSRLRDQLAEGESLLHFLYYFMLIMMLNILVLERLAESTLVTRLRDGMVIFVVQRWSYFKDVLIAIVSLLNLCQGATFNDLSLINNCKPVCEFFNLFNLLSYHDNSRFRILVLHP
jgi:hypothetical protein